MWICPAAGCSRTSFSSSCVRSCPDFVTGIFPALTEPEHTYIAGLSLGGFGTLIHGLTNPEQYKAMGVFSVGGYLPPQTDENGNVVEPPDSWQPMKLARKIEKGKAASSRRCTLPVGKRIPCSPVPISCRRR